jgi:hypothetical protein
MEAVLGAIPVGMGVLALGTLLLGQLCAPVKAGRRGATHGSARACLRVGAALRAI